MTIRKIIDYPLDAEKTLSYFGDHINSGKMFSQRVCEKIDFTQGSFFTILPEGMSLEKLFCFELGIISMAAQNEENYQIESRSDPTQVSLRWRTMDSECSEFVAGFLNESFENWAVVDDYNFDLERPSMKLKKVNVSLHGLHGHYFLNRNNSVEEVLLTILTGDYMWHSLVVLTQLEGEIPSVLTDSIIDEICDNVKFVLTGAYDAEGYVFWQAKEKLLLEKK